MNLHENFEVILSSEKIQSRVTELAKQLTEDYDGKKPLFICLLNGAFMFFTDLVRRVDLDLSLKFIKAQSYYNLNKSSGNVEVTGEHELDLAGYDVIIVDDIIDTGLTMQKVGDILMQKGANSVKSCCLLSKKAHRQVSYKPDYIGFEVDDFYVFGYGLDDAQRFRHLNDICIIKK